MGDKIGIKSEIMAYAVIAFILFGILFGVQIMSFIFGQLGPEAAGLTVGSAVFNVSANIQNNSLNGLQTYSRGANSQFNTVSIAIILILLIGVFLIFWKVLMGNVVGKVDNKEGNFA